MGRMKPNARSDFAIFNVYYEGGTLTSNEKVPLHEVDSLDGEQSIQAVGMALSRRERFCGSVEPPDACSLGRPKSGAQRLSNNLNSSTNNSMAVG